MAARRHDPGESVTKLRQGVFPALWLSTYARVADQPPCMNFHHMATEQVCNHERGEYEGWLGLSYCNLLVYKIGFARC